MAYIGDMSLNEIDFILMNIRDKEDDAIYYSVRSKLERARIRAVVEADESTNWFFNQKNIDTPISNLIPSLLTFREKLIDDINFSTVNTGNCIRIINALHRSGCKTLGDILDKTPFEIMKLRNLGYVSQNEFAESLWSLQNEMESPPNH